MGKAERGRRRSAIWLSYGGRYGCMVHSFNVIAMLSMENTMLVRPYTIVVTFYLNTLVII